MCCRHEHKIFIQLSWHVPQCLRLSRFVQAELNGNIKGLVAMMPFVQTKSEMRACIANDEMVNTTVLCGRGNAAPLCTDSNLLLEKGLSHRNCATAAPLSPFGGVKIGKVPRNIMQTMASLHSLATIIQDVTAKLL